MAEEWIELDEALGLSPSSSPHPSPTLSDRSSDFSYAVPAFPDRDGSPQRGLRRPSKKRRAEGATAQQPHRQPQQTAAPGGRLADAHAPAGVSFGAAAACGPQAATAAAAGALPSASPHAPPADGACVLQALPLQLLLRLLSFLSAQDLTAAAQASTLLRSLADEAVLWRRLFCARWGKPRGPQQLPPRTWKARYVERDLVELQEARARDASAMFLEAQIAKRSRALGRAHVDDPMEVPDDVARKVDAWRAARGFAPLPGVQQVSGQQQQKQVEGQGQQRAVVGQQGGLRGAQRQGAPPAPAKDVPPLSASEAGGTMLGASGSADAAVATTPLSAPAGGRNASQQTEVRAGTSDGGAAATGVCGGRGLSALVPPRRTQQQQPVAPQQRGTAIDHRWCRVSGTPNVYCSEATGDVHICDGSCTEVVLERSSGLLVCSISGTVRHDLGILGPQEVEGEEDEEGAAAEEGDFGGRLARAFEAGYHAESLEELERTCMVPRRR